MHTHTNTHVQVLWMNGIKIYSLKPFEPSAVSTPFNYMPVLASHAMCCFPQERWGYSEMQSIICSVLHVLRHLTIRFMQLEVDWVFLPLCAEVCNTKQISGVSVENSNLTTQLNVHLVAVSWAFSCIPWSSAGGDSSAVTMWPNWKTKMCLCTVYVCNIIFYILAIQMPQTLSICLILI